MSNANSSIVRAYNKFGLSKEQLKKEYDDLGNCGKIAVKYGFSEPCVREWMKKYDLPLKQQWSRGGHNIFPILGQKFGHLTVIEKVPRRERDNGEAKWLCKCDCGETVITGSNRLRRGITKSCGCLRVKTNAPNSYEKLSHAYWSRVLRGAEVRGLIVEITPKQAWEKFVEQGARCALSGEEIKLTNPYRGKDGEQTASLDRIDSKKGYTVENIQWIHKYVNIMKLDFSDEEFRGWCAKIYLFTKSQSHGIMLSEVGT